MILLNAVISYKFSNISFIILSSLIHHLLKVMKNIWEMPLHDIAHELGLMNFIYYMLIKTGFLPPIIFMGVGALTDFIIF